MVLGHIQLADDVVTTGCWHGDSLWDCYNDDTLWGYNIRVTGAVKQEKTCMNDSVCIASTFDWKGMNVLGNQACQMIHWSCPTIFHVFQRVLKIEKQVRGLQSIFLFEWD